MSVTKRFFGKTTDGAEASIFTLSNNKGMTVEISNFGGIILSIIVPDKNGKLADVVLAYDSIEKYYKRGPYFGAIVGRVANRIENGSFELNGIIYRVAQNDGNNHLHGGLIGFDKVLWEGNITSEAEFDSLNLTYRSKDEEEGYPGNLDVKVTYTLTNNNELEIHYYALSDKDTVVNLTNHAYFNLGGHDAGDILNHRVMINANKFTPNNEVSIPTGEIREVLGTPMDFTKLTKIGDVIEGEYEQLKFGLGYDHNWVLNVSGVSPQKGAEVYDDCSGRALEVYTTKPGIQLYTGNYLDGTDIGKGSVPYEKRSGLCLETQFYPNAINCKSFPSPILKAGEIYNHLTIYKFSTR